ncbi:hypothetical protein K0B04_01780 [Patescibacteria group bacterium]|nr:hypothetical protein [Patescibacteria group bacterium]
MKFSKDILKIFTLDWVITTTMYISGLLISGIKGSEAVDIVKYFSNSDIPVSQRRCFDGFLYFFMSMGFVILISYLINKSYFKVSKKHFFISQVLYFLSVLLIILFLTLII